MNSVQYRLNTIHQAAFLLRPEDHSWCRKFPSVAEAIAYLRAQRMPGQATVRVFAIDDRQTELISLG